MWARLDLTLEVLNAKAPPRSTYYKIIKDASTVSELPFDIRWDIEYPLYEYWKDREVFLDMTSRPTQGADPLVAWFVGLMRDEDNRLRLVGFGTIDLRQPESQLRLEAWPEMDGLLSTRIADWPWLLPTTPY